MTTRERIEEAIACIVVLIVFCLFVMTGLPNRYSNTPILEKSTIDLTNNVKSEQSKATKLLFFFNKKEIEFKELQQKYKLAKSEVATKDLLLKKLQAKSTKPTVQVDLKNCNDTLQSLYNFSRLKDSTANGVITDLNGLLFQSDSIIYLQDDQKNDLLQAVLHKSNAISDLEKLNENQKSLTRQEKIKKTFWQISTVTAVGIIGKLIMFK